MSEVHKILGGRKPVKPLVSLSIRLMSNSVIHMTISSEAVTDNVLQLFNRCFDKTRAIFYDLTAKQKRFYFRSQPQDKCMIFTATKDADIIKNIWPDFEIKQDARKNRYAELVISYE